MIGLALRDFRNRGRETKWRWTGIKGDDGVRSNLVVMDRRGEDFVLSTMPVSCSWKLRKRRQLLLLFCCFIGRPKSDSGIQRLVTGQNGSCSVTQLQSLPCPVTTRRRCDQCICLPGYHQLDATRDPTTVAICSWQPGTQQQQQKSQTEKGTSLFSWSISGFLSSVRWFDRLSTNQNCSGTWVTN